MPPSPEQRFRRVALISQRSSRDSPGEEAAPRLIGRKIKGASVHVGTSSRLGLFLQFSQISSLCVARGWLDNAPARQAGLHGEEGVTENCKGLQELAP